MLTAQANEIVLPRLTKTSSEPIILARAAVLKSNVITK